MELGAIGELVGGVAVIASLIFVGLQIRQSNRLTRAEAVQAYVDTFNRDVFSLLQDQNFCNTVRRGMSDFQSLNKDEQLTVHAAWGKILYLGQAEFVLRRGGLVEEEFAEMIQGADVALLSTPGAAYWWSFMKEAFAPAYASHLEGLLAAYQGPSMIELVPWFGPDESEDG
jgi:hypothetical protein